MTTDLDMLVMRLEHWCVVSSAGPYTPPELATKQLHGNVYGHPNHDDGKEVTTSNILYVEDGKVFTQSGSIYELGEIDPDYELAYPCAREKVLSA